jgi:hypothetical protein
VRNVQPASGWTMDTTSLLRLLGLLLSLRLLLALLGILILGWLLLLGLRRLLLLLLLLHCGQCSRRQAESGARRVRFDKWCNVSRSI